MTSLRRSSAPGTEVAVRPSSHVSSRTTIPSPRAHKLRKYVGPDVTLIRVLQRNGATVEEEVKARLLSYNNAPVWQIGSEIVTGLHADHIRFPELPGNLYSRPTLIWTLDNGGATRHRVEASYLAGQLSWKRRLTS